MSEDVPGPLDRVQWEAWRALTGGLAAAGFGIGDVRAVPGHLCFADADRRVLFSGDHVLPKITPNISMHPQQRANPLQDFFDSLRKVAELDASGPHDVLPAHEYRFAGLSGRVAHLLAHHEERLDEIEKALRERPGAGCWGAVALLETSVRT